MIIVWYRVGCPRPTYTMYLLTRKINTLEHKKKQKKNLYNINQYLGQFELNYNVPWQLLVFNI